MKDARFTTANQVETGTEVEFIILPSQYDKHKDKRMFKEVTTVTDIIPNKSGKRVEVKFSNGHCVFNIGWNTPFSQISDKCLKEHKEQYGCR